MDWLLHEGYAIFWSVSHDEKMIIVAGGPKRKSPKAVADADFSAIFAIDILGYGFMDLATVFAARMFDVRGLERWIRWSLSVSGCLAPVIVLQILYPPLWRVVALLGRQLSGCGGDVGGVG